MRALPLLVALLVAVSSKLVLAQTTFQYKVYTGGTLSFTSPQFATGTDIEVVLGTVTDVRTVHIYSYNTRNQPLTTLPDAGAGRIKLSGSATATGRVNVLISHASQSVFPANGDLQTAQSLASGLTMLGGTLTSSASSSGGYSHDYDAAPWATSNSTPSYGGPVFADWGNADLKGIIIPDPSLRRQTVLAAVVAGDICPDTNGAGTKGRIEVGQVLRLEAR